MAFADVTSETFAFTCILFDLECARGIDNVPHGFLVGDCKAVDLFFCILGALLAASSAMCSRNGLFTPMLRVICVGLFVPMINLL